MLVLRIALRYLFSRKSHSAVNVISVVSLAGVAVATAAMVCVLSVFNGFRDLAAERFSTLDPDFRIVPAKGKTIAGADSLAVRLDALDCVAVAVPELEEQALAVYGDRQTAVRMRGVGEDWGRLARLGEVVIDGEWLGDNPSLPAAAVSVGTALTLGARPDPVTPMSVYMPRRTGRVNPANPAAAFRTDSLWVTAVMQTNRQEIDRSLVVVPLERMRRLLDYDGGEASAIGIGVAPGHTPREALRALREACGTGVRVLDRYQQEESSFKMIEVEKWVTFLMLAFILVIASFNIVSTLSMLVIEKEGSIFILGAMGAPQRMVRGVFVLEGWLISFFGAVAGLLLGVVLVLAQQYGGFIELGGDHALMSVTAYPVRLSWTDLPAVFAVVMGVGLLTGLVSLLIQGGRR